MGAATLIPRLVAPLKGTVSEPQQCMEIGCGVRISTPMLRQKNIIAFLVFLLVLS